MSVFLTIIGGIVLAVLAVRGLIAFIHDFRRGNGRHGQ